MTEAEGTFWTDGQRFWIVESGEWKLMEDKADNR